MIRAGMDVVRLNFSHGSHDWHRKTFGMVRRIAEEMEREILIFQDLSGPKIRIGVFEKGEVNLAPGREFRIITRDIIGNREIVSTNLKSLPEEVSKGHRVLLDDGLIEMEVIEISGDEVRCEVLIGGTLKDHKGINLPNTPLKVPALTEKDKRDLELGISLGIDYVALSFVQRPEDLHQIKQFMKARQAEIPVIAKFERPQAVKDMDRILPLCDAVMVARGDLGIEMAPEKVPLIQKELVSKANDHDLPVIVATQMLESMISNPRPTRAETSDVANAILDGTDAVMLSGETAVGAYPFEAVAVMSRIICEVETRGHESPVAQIAQRIENDGLGWIRDEYARNCKAVCHSARSISNDTNIKAICALTKSGFTANLISHFRPMTPVYAYSHRPEVRRRLSLSWGVTPRPIEWKDTVKGMLADIEMDLLKNHGLKEGDSIVLLFGYPIEKSGTTNAVMIQTLGKGDKA